MSLTSVMAGLVPAIHVLKVSKTRIPGTSPGMTQRMALFGLNPRPGPPVRAHLLPGLGEPEHPEVVETAANDLEADGQARLRKAGIDG